MDAFGSFEFDGGDRTRIYRYVERHGAVEPDEVAEHVRVDPETFRHHVSVLKRDGHIEESDGMLRVALERGEAERHQSSGLEFVVRPARQEDLSGVLGVIEAVATDRTDIVAESVAEQLDYEDALIRHNAGETRVFFVATVREDVVGWCHVEIPRPAKLANTATLTLGVLEEYRRHGIGSHLLQRGLSWAGAEGCRKVYNSIPATNDTALSFLRENGWQVEAVRADHFEIDGDLVDEVMLAREL